jgi:uncharacterized protein YkwD
MHPRYVVATLLIAACFAFPHFAAAQQGDPAATVRIYLPLVLTPPATTAQTPEQHHIAGQLRKLLNAERAAAGCRPVVSEDHLIIAAQGHSQSMAEEDYFGHIAPDGSTAGDRAVAAGYRGLVGENIAAGYATAEKVMQAWMESEGHRKNILNCRYVHVGIGYLYQSDDQPGVQMPSGEPSEWPFYHYWTLVFGRPD